MTSIEVVPQVPDLGNTALSFGILSLRAMLTVDGNPDAIIGSPSVSEDLVYAGNSALHAFVAGLVFKLIETGFFMAGWDGETFLSVVVLTALMGGSVVSAGVPQLYEITDGVGLTQLSVPDA